jgi:uncharacterized MAPEG superfamily protein
MTPLLQILSWTLVLALVQVFLPVIIKTQQYGPKWNAGPRDQDVPPPSILAGRLDRAQRNLYETLPIFIAAVLIAQIGAADAALSLLGAQLYLGSRVLYVPIYALGIPYVRTLVWMVGLAGLVALLYAILTA